MEKYKAVNPDNTKQSYEFSARDFSAAERKVKASLSHAVKWVIYNISEESENE